MFGQFFGVVVEEFKLLEVVYRCSPVLMLGVEDRTEVGF